MSQKLTITITVPASWVDASTNTLVVRLYESTKVFAIPSNKQTPFYVLEDQYDMPPINYINSSMVYRIPDAVKQKLVQDETKNRLKKSLDKMYKDIQKTPGFSDISREDFIKMLTEE